MGWRANTWLLGVPVLAAVWALSTWLAIPKVEDELRRAIEARPEIASLRSAGARVEVHGRDARIVTDFALPAPAREAVERLAREISGLRRIEVATAVAVALVPFRFTVARDQNGIVLSGGVPAGSLHGRLLDAVRRTIGSGAIDDRLTPGSGAPPAFEEAAELAARLALRLARGEVVVSDRVLALTGEAGDPASYAAVTSGLLSLPPGYTLGQVDLTPPVARPFTWTLRRGPNGLSLAGNVPSEPARRALRDAIATAVPGLDVTDEMATARGLDPSVSFEALARAAVSTLGQLDEGRVVFDGRTLAVSGTGIARDVLAELPGQLRRDLPPSIAIGTVSLVAVPASPYRFAAKRGGGRLALSGFVPDAPSRDALRGLAERRFAGEAIGDDLHLAAGAPESFATAAGLAVEALADLAEARAEFVDRKISLAGRALYGEMAEQTRRRFVQGLPPGWTGAVDIKIEPAEKYLEAGLCGDLLADSVRREPIRFEPNRPEIAGKAQPALAALAGILRRCGPVPIRIVVASETGGDLDAARTLAESRSATLVRALAPGQPATLSPQGRAERSRARPEGAGAKPSGDDILFVVAPQTDR